jgi:tetratricopeptide (TPR) repeat protein
MRCLALFLLIGSALWAGPLAADSALPPPVVAARPPAPAAVAGQLAPQPRGLGYEILQLEAVALSHLTKGATEELDALCQVAAKQVPMVTSWPASPDVARRTMKAIGDLLYARGYRYKVMTFLSEALTSKYLDCDTGTMVYVTLARQRGLPVHPAFAPCHCLVLCPLATTALYWETTLNQIDTFEGVCAGCKVDPALAGKVYLAPVTHAQCLAYYKAWLAVRLHEMTEPLLRKPDQWSRDRLGALRAQAAKLMAAATSEFPHPHTWAVSANLAFDEGNLTKALREADKALAIDSECAMAHSAKGSVHLTKGEYAAATIAYTAALRFDTSNSASFLAMCYNRRGQAWDKLRKPDQAATDLLEAKRLAPQTYGQPLPDDIPKAPAGP